MNVKMALISEPNIKMAEKQGRYMDARKDMALVLYRTAPNKK